MRILLFSYSIAGLFGFLFVQGAVESLQAGMTHSGNQPYVRVIQ